VNPWPEPTTGSWD